MKNSLKNLKKEYGVLAKKFKLPAFEKINEDFEIEKVEARETDHLARVVRKAMMEKIVNSLGFLEMLLNPVNAPKMYLICVKSLKPEDMRTIEKMYGLFAELMLAALELELEYNEKSEAAMIKYVYETWASVRKQFKIILQRMRCARPIADSEDMKKEKSYFG